MNDRRFFNGLWASFVVDRQLRVHEVMNPDDRLFFGKFPSSGEILTTLDNEENRSQMEVFIQGVERAVRENRNTCFEYLSMNAPDFYVGVYTRILDDELISLQLIPLNDSDLQQHPQEKKLQESDNVLNAIYEHLPIGMEIYDREGRMIEINACELANIGISDKREVLGLNLFENPNLSEKLKLRLKARESFTVLIDYNFDCLMNYYKTPKKGICHLEVSFAVMCNRAGEIDKYLVISKDVTERIQLQQKNKSLHNQNIAILNALPVGVGLYAPDGTLVYCNERMEQIFGIDCKEYMKKSIYINHNSIVPQEVKNAVVKEMPIQINFPYNFGEVFEAGYYATEHRSTRYIKCNGQPIFNTSGKMENYVFIMEDITDVARNEEILRQNKRKMEMAIRVSETMVWEFDIKTQLFFSENEPMNGRDYSKYVDLDTYANTAHEDDREFLNGILGKMMIGEDFSFNFDARIIFPDSQEWQYCIINGSPYEYDDQGRVLKYVGTRKNNNELQKRKLLQDKILNSIPLAIDIKDVEDDFRYVFCNNESKLMFGTDENKRACDVMSVQEVERIQKTDLEVFGTGNSYLGHEQILLNDGRSYDTIVRKSIIYDGGKRLLLTVSWDQGLQKDLERRAKVLSLTMEAMNAYTWFFEPQKNRVSFGEGFDKVCSNIQQVNTVEKFASYIHPEDRQEFVNTLQKLSEEESGEWCVEYRSDLNDDGVYEWWETRGILETSILNEAQYKYMFGMSICIESHKQVELTLLRNKEHLDNLICQNELVLNNTNSGLAYITPDYMVLWENISKCSPSLSYEAYKKGEFCYKSAHNRTSPCENCVLQRAAKSRQMEQIKFVLDSNHAVEIFATPVFRANDELDGIVIRMDDITERERIFEELCLAKARAEQSDKLKSAFLANMSHEIRTPLNAIVGFSELLMNTIEEDTKSEYMRIIYNNNDLLLKLINDILDLSKLEADSIELKYEEFDLSEYFNEIAGSMKQRVTNPNVRLIPVNPHPCCMVTLDRNRIAQIMINYVTNAIKYTPQGFIEMGYKIVNKGIRLYVRDSGIGIADDKKNKVFHRFEKLDEFAQGTGLGLSICKAIAESMNGSVGFESVHAEGSYFWAFLPCKTDLLLHENVQEEVMAHVYTKSETGRRKTILVAEDIASNYLLISAILQKHFDLIHAKNGQEAVEIARTKEIDLVLMDMKMPSMNGLIATEEIRRFNDKLPIVALTAHAFESDRRIAMEMGCNDYLVKPIGRDKLMAVLQRYFSFVDCEDIE